MHVVQAQLADLVSGTRYRGDLERLQRLLDRATAEDNLVLFRAEIHLVIQAGADGPMDVANMLKPALASSG